MSRRVTLHPIVAEGETSIAVPVRSRLVGVQVIGAPGMETVAVIAVCDARNEFDLDARDLFVGKTTDEIPDAYSRYIGTVQMTFHTMVGVHVLHVFERSLPPSQL